MKNFLYYTTLFLLLLGCKSQKLDFVEPELKSYVSKVLSVEDARNFDYFFIEAERHKIAGDYNKALASFQKCLSFDPESAVVYFELGNLFLAANEVQTAVSNFQMAVQLNPEIEWYQVFLATLYQQIKDYKSAIASYEKLASSFPDKIEYHYRLAILYTQEQAYQKAIQKYNEIEHIHGLEEAISLEKFKLYLELNDGKSAISEIKKLVAANPDQPRFVVLLGDAYVQTREYKKGFKAYRSALKLNPSYGQAHLSLAGYYDIIGDSVSSREELFTAFKSEDLEFTEKMPVLVQVMRQESVSKQRTTIVEELVNILLQHYPDEPDLHFYYGNYLMSQSQKSEAINQFVQVVELDPSRYETWLQLAGFQMEEANWDSVISITDDIILNHSDRPEVYLYKGLASFSQKDYLSALDALLEGLKYVDENNQIEEQFLSTIGDAYYFLQEKEKAFSYYEKALELDDHNVVVLNNYSYYLSLENTDLDRAERMSAKCVELEPGNSTYLDTYAWVLYKKKDYFLAKFYIEQAISNMKDQNGVIVEHYGDILYRLGEKSKALEAWKRALELGSDSELLPLKIERKELIEE